MAPTASASAAARTLLLRGSKHAGSGSYEQVLELASDAMGADLDGYRHEFVELVRAARGLDARAMR